MSLNVKLLWRGLNEDAPLVESYSPGGRSATLERPIYSVTPMPAVSSDNNASSRGVPAEYPVVPLKYRGSAQRIGLEVRCTPPLKPSASVVLSFNRDPSLLSASGWGHPHIVNQGQTTPVPGGIVVSFSVDELLNTLGARVNEDVIWARVKVIQDGESASVQTPFPLHVLLRKAIVLLPGVLGSTLWVGEPPELCWPPLAATDQGKVAAFLKLATDAQGMPDRAPSQMSLVGEHIYGVSNVKPGPYRTADWEVMLNRSLPQLKKYTSPQPGAAEPLHHYFIQGWPYDWRLSAPKLIDMMLEERLDEWGAPMRLGDVYAPNPLFRAGDFEGYENVARPPPLATLIAYYARVDPFISDKVALAGHSTGGVIMNGAVRDARAAQYVDQAFFIGTPFLGAPKALKVLLRGTMDLSALEEWVAIDGAALRRLGGNLAVPYFLAPTPDYPYPIIELSSSGTPTRFNAPQLTDGMNALLQKAAFHGLTSIVNDQVTWRPGLATAASQYVSFIQRTPVSIGDSNCVVFYSKSSKATVMGAHFNGRSGVVTKDPESLLTFPTSQDGDGTVPQVSLLGMQNALGHNTVLITGDVDHTKIVASVQLWTAIARRFADALTPPQQRQQQELELDLGSGTATAAGRWYRQGRTLVIELGA